MKKSGLWLLGFLGFLIVENIANRILDRAIEWIWPKTPSIMFTIYEILITLVAIAFAIALVYMLLRALRSAWSLKNREQRRNAWEMVREKVRQWPTGKKDAFTVMAMTWIVAIYVPLFVMIFTVPEGQLAGRIPIETILITLILAILPMYALFGWHGYEYARQFWQKWRTETGKGRIRLALPVIAVVLIVALFVWGDVSGWDDRAWFAN